MARVNFISAQAEFTPPIIYSQEERARLVFRIEAIPERPGDAARRPARLDCRCSRHLPGVSHARR